MFLSLVSNWELSSLDFLSIQRRGKCLKNKSQLKIVAQQKFSLINHLLDVVHCFLITIICLEVIHIKDAGS